MPASLFPDPLPPSRAAQDDGDDDGIAAAAGGGAAGGHDSAAPDGNPASADIDAARLPATADAGPEGVGAVVDERRADSHADEDDEHLDDRHPAAVAGTAGSAVPGAAEAGTAGSPGARPGVRPGARPATRLDRWFAASPAFAPLARPVFRMLWLTWLTSHTCMWMNDVAAAWLMSSLHPSPAWVAAVQAAATLPVFLLGVPSGALADILDRRRYFLFTQIWLAAIALLMFVIISAGQMTAELLIVLTFLNGIGLALRWPTFSAIVPELVDRAQLPAAMGLNGIAMNASRIAGPLIAGAIIASSGSRYVFLLNAVLSIASAIAIFTWRRQQKASVLPGERFLGAIRVGLRYVRASLHFRPLLVRVGMFSFHTSVTMALLPLLARELRGPDPHAFTLLLACLGLGAISSVLVLPRLRGRYDADRLVRDGSLLQAAAVAGIALSPWYPLTMLLMGVNGMAWIAIANSLSVSAQLSLPNWVRARGMAVFQVAMMGCGAVGALCWGQIATVSDVRTAILVAALSSVLMLVLAHRVRIAHPPAEQVDLISREPPVAVGDVPGHAGPVVVLIEYRIDPAQRREFLAVMEETRRSRLQQGAISWELLRRSDDPAIYTEMMVDETWVDHLRHFDRTTAADIVLRDRRRQFHLGDEPPKVTRSIGQRLRVSRAPPAAG
ncbi:MAG: MFS transporter [Lautropia sp.]